jgi:hypothetical protein
MWIIPSNLPGCFQYAPEYAASKEELNERLAQSEPLLMWKSKPLSSKTFWLAWKRVWWMQHLSGRILKPSMQSRFVIAWTESLADTRANHLAPQENEEAQKTQDTFGRMLRGSFAQSDLFGDSLKTSADTLPLDSIRFIKVFQEWTMQLRRESLQRRKLARHIRENGYSSSQLEKTAWRTPTAQAPGINPDRLDGEAGSRMYDKQTGRLAQYGLDQQVHMWHTPLVQDSRNSGTMESRQKRVTQELATQVQNWGTPRVATNQMIGNTEAPEKSRLEDQVLKWCTPVATMYKGSSEGALIRKDGKERSIDRLDLVVQAIYGQQDQENSNTTGKRRTQLNPAWVLQLMGTTLEKTFFVPLATQWLSKQQNSLSEPS